MPGSLEVEIRGPEREPAGGAMLVSFPLPGGVAYTVGAGAEWPLAGTVSDADERGRVEDPFASGHVALRAIHPQLGVGVGRAFAPGRAVIRLRGGPEVFVDASDVPMNVRRELLILRVYVADPPTWFDYQIGVGEAPTSIGRWPSGIIQLTFGRTPWEARWQTFVVPSEGPVTCKLAWPPTSEAARIRLDSHEGSWSLHPMATGSGHSGFTSAERPVLESDADGSLALLHNAPSGPCRAESSAAVPRWFRVDNLAKAPDGALSVPADAGCRCKLVLARKLRFDVDVQVLGFEDAARRALDFTDERPVSGSMHAGRRRLDEIAWITTLDESFGTTGWIDLPSHARIGLYGCDDQAQVRATFQTGAPGTTLEVHVTEQDAATLTMPEGVPWAWGVATLRSNQLEAAPAPLEVPVAFSALPVPFSGVLTLTAGARQWRYEVEINAPGRHMLDVEGVSAEPLARYEILVYDEQEKPVPGAVVALLGPDYVRKLHAHTDAEGIAVFEAAGAFEMAEVVMAEEGRPGGHVLVGDPGRYEIEVEMPAWLEVAVGSSHVGQRRTIRVLWDGTPIGVGTDNAIILGSSVTRWRCEYGGPYTVILLDASGRELVRKDVELAKGRTGRVTFE